MGDIEAELRSFITKEEYDRLLGFFRKSAKFIKEDEQETHYFDSDVDLRIQKNNFFSKVWIKRGKIHDEAREELELKLPREDFEKLGKIFKCLGLGVSMKWFRKRLVFEWEGVTACLDDTKGYGLILELEKMCSEKEKEHAVVELRKKFGQLGVKITPREEFEKRFESYRKNRRKMTGEGPP